MAQWAELNNKLILIVKLLNLRLKTQHKPELNLTNPTQLEPYMFHARSHSRKYSFLNWLCSETEELTIIKKMFWLILLIITFS